MYGAVATFVEDLFTLFVKEGFSLGVKTVTTVQDLTSGVHTAAFEVGIMASTVTRGRTGRARRTLAASAGAQTSGTGTTAGKRGHLFRRRNGQILLQQRRQSRALLFDLGGADQGDLKVGDVCLAVVVVHQTSDFLAVAARDHECKLQIGELVDVRVGVDTHR